MSRNLVSGTDDELLRFNLAVFMALNGIERRGQTILYTCFDEHLQAALRIATREGVTVQRIHGADDHETYETLVQGARPGWEGAP